VCDVVIIKTFSIAEDVLELLDRVPVGKKSEVINEALRRFFELDPQIDYRSKRRKPSRKSEDLKPYPPEELTVDDL
jgi:hypothetical protein